MSSPLAIQTIYIHVNDHATGVGSAAELPSGTSIACRLAWVDSNLKLPGIGMVQQ